MANIIVLIIILGCIGFLYTKISLVKCVTYLIIAICSIAAAFGFYEVLANVVISRSSESFTSLAPWAQPLSLILLFILAYAILQTIATQIFQKTEVDLGIVFERAGRVICGLFMGVIISGFLITALAMAPLSPNYPYERFSKNTEDIQNPAKLLVNVDGFAASLSGTILNGCFAGERSFETLHPDFVSQAFLTRLNASKDLSILSSEQAIEVPSKKAFWPAGDKFRDSDNKAIAPKSGCNLTMVQIGFKRNMLREAGKFTLAQLRLVCRKSSQEGKIYSGESVNVYPVGYLQTAEQIKMKKLTDTIELKAADVQDNVKWMNFAFYVPDGFVPILVEFKQNSIAEVPRGVVTEEQAPEMHPYIPASEKKKETAKPSPAAAEPNAPESKPPTPVNNTNTPEEANAPAGG